MAVCCHGEQRDPHSTPAHNEAVLPHALVIGKHDLEQHAGHTNNQALDTGCLSQPAFMEHAPPHPKKIHIHPHVYAASANKAAGG